jgi:hypothetical protein
MRYAHFVPQYCRGLPRGYSSRTLLCERMALSIKVYSYPRSLFVVVVVVAVVAVVVVVVDRRNLNSPPPSFVNCCQIVLVVGYSHYRYGR